MVCKARPRPKVLVLEPSLGGGSAHCERSDKERTMGISHCSAARLGLDEG